MKSRSRHWSKASHKNSSRSMRLVLEPRMVFDGSVADTAAEALQDNVDNSGNPTVAPASDANIDFAPALDTAPVAGEIKMPPVFEAITDLFADQADVAASPNVSPQTSIVFIDSAVDDPDSIVEAIDPAAEIVYLDDKSSGLTQVAEYLSNRSGIDNIQIISHSQEATLILGNETLTNDNLAAHAEQLTAIGKALTDNGDILLYGCELAKSADGAEFINRFADLTRADVAASTDITGAADKGGNWNLEYNAGQIETASLAATHYQGTLIPPAEGFGGTDYNADTVADPLRLITWNVIGLDSNNPENSGPDTFMVGLRVDANAAGLSNLTVKIVEDNGVNVFGAGSILIGDTNVAADGGDGIDQIHLINKTVFTNPTIAASGYKDFYFNVKVDRLNTAYNQIQPFHFEVFQDNGAGGGTANDGIKNGTEIGVNLTKFSWLADSASANTPLYLYVEKYISQARNDVRNETVNNGDSSVSAIRIYDNAAPAVQLDTSVSATVFVGQTINVRVEGQTATAGYPQLEFSTVFNNNMFQIQKVNQFYNVPVTELAYQQGLGTGDTGGTFSSTPFANDGTTNTSMYANPAGWNPATHGTIITSAPPKAGGGPIISDYQVLVTGTGGSKLDTLILDYSGSSFHYNADMNTGVNGQEYINFTVLNGSIVGNVGVDTDGDSVGNTDLSGITVSLYKDVNANGAYDGGDTLVSTATTNAKGNYLFNSLLPDKYVVVEGATTGYADVTDTDGTANSKNTVAITINTAATVGYIDLNEDGTNDDLDGDGIADQFGYQRADFVEAQPDLQLTQTVDTTGPQLGGNVNFTLTVTNTSSADVAAVEVTDKLPTGLTYQSSTGTYAGATGIWTVGSLTAGQSKTITLTARVDTNTAIGNFAEITSMKDASAIALGDSDSTVANNKGADTTYGTSDDGSRTPFEDDEAKITIDAAEADLSIVTSISNPNPTVGDTLTFTVAVTNSGPDAATGVKVTDDLTVLDSSINLSTLTVTNAGASVNAGLWTLADGSTFDTNPGATYGVWNVKNGGSLASGSTTALTFTATVDKPGAITNYAEITAGNQYDPDSSVASNRTVDDKTDTLADDDEAVATAVPHSADLSLTKTVDISTPDENSNVVYTLFLTNSGPDDATGVSIVDVLPAGLLWVSATGTGATISHDAGLNTAAGGNVTWSGISIAKGETKIYTLTATVKNSSVLTSTAQITASSLADPDSVVGLNSATDDWSDGVKDDDEAGTTITPGATDLALFKSYVVDDGTLDTLNETVTFTLTVLNAGPKAAYNIQVKDVLPSGLTYLSTVAGGVGTYTSATGIWDLASDNTALASGATASISFKATVNKVLAQTNFAQIIEADKAGTDAQNGTSTLFDPDSRPNNDADNTANEDDEASVTLPAIPYADLELTQTVSNANPGLSGSTTFTLSLTNAGTVTATNIQVTDYISKWALNGSGDINQITGIAVSKGTYSGYATLPVADGADLIWSIPSLTFGETATLAITVSTGASASGNASASFDNDVFNFAQVTAVDQPDPDSTKADNALTAVSSTGVATYTKAFQDDESVAVINSPASARIDVALTETVAVTNSSNTPKTNTEALVVGDKTTYTVTAINQGGGADNPIIFSNWATGYLTLNTVQQNAANGTISYSINNGSTWTAFSNTTSNTVNLATVTVTSHYP